MQSLQVMQLNAKEHELEGIQKEKIKQSKVVKDHYRSHRECLNQLITDYTDFCNWNDMLPDEEFLEQVEKMNPVDALVPDISLRQ